ncbi:MAG TPA: hypothetical protein VGO86_05965 [Candidatus Dormibacteraeota bacterium]
MRCGILLMASLFAGLLACSPVTALAGTGTGACAGAALPVAHAAPTPDVRRTVAAYKAAHDRLRAPVDHAVPRPAAATAHLTGRGRPGGRAAGPRACPATATAGFDRVVLGSLAQQGQATSYYCGPALVAEAAATRGLQVDQATAAAWMGTDPGAGTGVDQLTSALDHFVAAPAGGSYAFVWLSYDPSGDERGAFVSRLRWDLTTYGGWPVAGDAWEVPDGPHLIGHPNVEIFHWIEIGGLGDGDTATYYADSATTVWSGVPDYSWIDTQALATILGGRGYAW